MQEPYRIRIRGPWQYELENGESGTVRVPGPWQMDRPSAQLRRHFNWLAQLTEFERVFIVFTGCGGTGRVCVNDTELGYLEPTSTTFEITDRLLPRNLLTIEMSFESLAPGQPRGLWGDVLLEIRTEQRSLGPC